MKLQHQVHVMLSKEETKLNTREKGETNSHG